MGAGQVWAAGGVLCLCLTLGMSRCAAAEPSAKAPAVPVGDSPGQQGASPASPSDSARWPSTEVWKTFRGSHGWNYTIEYPSTAEIVEDDSYEDFDITFAFEGWFPDAFGKRQTIALMFAVLIGDNPQNLPPKEWALKDAPEFEKKLFQYTRKHLDPTFEDMKVAGRPAYRVKLLNPYDGKWWYHIYVADGKKVYLLTFHDPQSFRYLPMDVRNHYSEVFQRTLESFSFGGK